MNPNNPFGSGPMKQWFHVECFFQLKKTKNSKTINSVDDIDGWDLLSVDDKETIVNHLGPVVKTTSDRPAKPSKDKARAGSKDNLFSEFQRIISKIANEPSYNSKSQILGKFLRDVSQN